MTGLADWETTATAYKMGYAEGYAKGWEDALEASDNAVADLKKLSEGAVVWGALYAARLAIRALSKKEG